MMAGEIGVILRHGRLYGLANVAHRGAGLLLVPFIAVVPPVAMPSPVEWANAVALALLSSGLAFVLYFRLIANVGPVKTLT